jgi:hypothetical protein
VPPIVGLCRAARWGLVETVLLANVAAGLEVERLGVAPVSWDEICAELQTRALSSEQVPRDSFPPTAHLLCPLLSRTLSTNVGDVWGEGQGEGTFRENPRHGMRKTIYQKKPKKESSRKLC